MSEGGSARSIGPLIQRGVAWKITSQIVTQGSRLFFGFALARLLTPHEYGLAAMAMIVSGFVLAFSDLGLGAALVQRPKVTEEDRSTVFWTGVGSGALLTLIGIALSWPVARFFGEPEVQGLLAALSLGFLVTSVATTQRSLLSREMNFRSLELRVMASTIVGGVVGVALAAKGFGPWAIVAQQLAIALVSTVALWIVTPWRPRFAFSVASLRELSFFSGRVFGDRLLYYGSESLTGALIGRHLGPASLGVFNVANNVVLTPFTRLAIPIGEVLFPAFSRIQDERDRVAALWLRALPLLTAMCVPALAGLAIVAPEFVTVVLGDRWHDAIPVIQIMAWVGIMNTMRAWNVGILMSLGRADLLFRFSVAFFVAYTAATLAGLPFGVKGVAAAFAVAATAVEGPYLWVVARQLRVSMREIAQALAGVLQSTGLMVASMLICRILLAETSAGPALRLAVLVPLGIAVFMFGCLWRAPGVAAELRGLRRRTPSPVAQVVPAVKP